MCINFKKKNVCRRINIFMEKNTVFSYRPNGFLPLKCDARNIFSVLLSSSSSSSFGRLDDQMIIVVERKKENSAAFISFPEAANYPTHLHISWPISSSSFIFLPDNNNNKRYTLLDM